VSLRGATTSLLARTNLTLGVSAILIALSATLALYAFVINPISEQSARDEAALLVLSAQTWVELPPDARPYFELEMAENHDLIISEAMQALPPLADNETYLGLLATQLSTRLGGEVELLQGDELVWVDVPMGGHDLQIGFAANRRDIEPLYVAVIIVTLGAAIVFFTSLFIVQRIARPIVKIAKQAERFRGATEMEPLPETGPRELASLARNFNTMSQEISILLKNRTTLLAGISHDLRTPLTRMRLALELLPDDVDAKLIERFERNLQSMDELIGDALHLARGTHEVAERVTVVPFVQEVLSTFERDIPFRCSVSPDYEALIAPSAFRRVLVNIVSNAIRHSGQVANKSTNASSIRPVEVEMTDTSIHVCDDGPGIPKEFREQVFQPFFRLESSRNRQTGGSGLGLAIVAQLCQAHDWEVVIGTSDSHSGRGARVTFRYVPIHTQDGVGDKATQNRLASASLSAAAGPVSSANSARPA